MSAYAKTLRWQAVSSIERRRKGCTMTQFLLEATTENSNMLMSLLPMILIVAVFYLMFIRPQKKREKQVQQMRSELEVGDEITTIGGLIGTVVVIKEDYLVIETSSDRNKLRITRWAVQSNNTSKVGDSTEEGPDLQ